MLLLLAAFPLMVQAATTEINSVKISVDLQPDGSGIVTEIWDVNAISDMTEWYLEKNQMGEREVTNLQVTDETGRQFENIGEWDIDKSIEEKAGKCGTVEKSDGVELCWGIGNLGPHVFTVTYTMTNMVMGYTDADALYQEFLPAEISSEPDYVRVEIGSAAQTFTKENTGVWAFGREGMPYGVEDGKIVLESENGLGRGERVAILAEFKTGMFQPVETHNRSFNSLLEEAKKGSDYGNDYGNENSGGFSSAANLIRRILPFLFVMGSVVVASIGATIKRANSSSIGMSQMKPEYKNPNYSRDLPWNNNLPATFTRLADLNKLPDEGTIIGAYLLRWIRSRQVEIIAHESNGFFGSKEETAIKLYQPRPDMETLEATLYNMLISAAGGDWVLQSKEFEKWSKAHFEKVQGWLEQYKNYGKGMMRMMGAAQEVETKVFFGLIPTRKTVLTPLGEQFTVNMFGFKKYLQEFTIINERQAKEVQLWDEYLVFAQVFGIADEVAGQFKNLYPDYFTKMATDMGMRPDLFDIYMITRLSNSYGRAMYTGYRAGYTAHVNRNSGGGGFSSGGGGFSAGGGGGSAGGR